MKHNRNLLKVATFDGGVIVLGVGAVTGLFYVCYNGRVAHKGSDEAVARQTFDRLVPGGAQVR